MNLRIESRKSSRGVLRDVTLGTADVYVLFPKSYNALIKNHLNTTNQKPARFEVSNDYISLSGFLSGENLNVNTYVDRRLPPGRDPCGDRRRKPPRGLRL